jgi:CRISPR-associated endonuclease/helicase Cas3
VIHPKNTGSKTDKSILPLPSCLAKTRSLEDGAAVPGINVFGHCVIVGEVAKALIKYSIPKVRDKLFPPGSELIAAVHDAGKICPSFQEKIYRSIAGYPRNSRPGLEKANPDIEKTWGGHAAVSQAALEGCPKYIPEIAGRHHGFSTHRYPSNAPVFGGESWQRQREKLIESLKTHFDADWPKVKNGTHAALLSGLTCVADWIGSGPAFDGFDHVETIDDLPHQAEAAVEAAGFVRPLVKRGLSFKDIFDFDCRPVQSYFIEAVSAPGLYVLEAPMGMGKTEAALYAAYNVLAAEKASGIYFALPTRLTSNKIYERMNKFLEKILAPQPGLQGEGSPFDEKSAHRKSLLLHGSAWLYKTEMGEEGQPGASWFNAGKRGILAPFAVGTIDQALMAVMNVKHGFVRTFGLAGKVVILDEVHSYDSYTGTILDELVQGLRELGCTVIILSATLTDERRRELLGCRETAPVSAYPLISYVREEDAELNAGGSKRPTEIPVEIPDTITVFVRRVSDDTAAIEEALKRAEQGQQVLWIENTVDEAQSLYLKLAGRAHECGVEAGLLHSRFTQADRQTNEAKWVGLYGTEGRELRRKRGRILIGTQVLEQSLDIDADFLITRLCPTDILLQRLGRLWRHEKTKLYRPEGACPELWLLAPDYDKALINHKTELRKSVPVYDPYVLLRTLEIWEDPQALNLPACIRRLVEETYRGRDEDGLLAKLKSEWNSERRKLENLALSGISKGGRTAPDTEASTRYSEQETLDVLLLQSVKKNEDGISLVFPDGEQIDLLKGLKRKDGREWRKRAAALNCHIVTVPKKRAPLAPHPKFLELFQDYIYTGKDPWDDENNDVLRIAIVNKSDMLEGYDGAAIIGDYDLSYDRAKGYRAEKKDKSKDDGSY